jgi:small subunit ribosomal protein S17
MAETESNAAATAVKPTDNKVTKVGVVIKAAMDKTVTVSVQRMMQHEAYKKYVRRNKKYLVHDEKGEAGVGDTVKIIECRPISKSKSWRLLEIISKAK